MAQNATNNDEWKTAKTYSTARKQILEFLQSHKCSEKEMLKLIDLYGVISDSESATTIAGPSFINKNKFDVLSDREDMDTDFFSDEENNKSQPERAKNRLKKRVEQRTESTGTKRRCTSETGHATTEENSNTTNSRTNRTEPKKMPTLIIRSAIPLHVIRNIKSELKSGLHVQYAHKYLCYVNTYNERDNEIVKERLRSAGYNFFGHAPKEERSKKLILRGLDPDVTEEEIKQDLITQNIKVTKVVQMTKNDQNNKKYKLPIYVIIMEPNQDLRAVRDIRNVTEYIVKWENVLPSDRVTQCFKCQLFGHTAKYCDMKFRCVKCLEDHGPKECTKKRNIDTPRCVNCQGEHPANYKNCSVLITAQERLLNNKERQRNRFIQAPPPAKQTKSYSDLFRDAPATHAVPPTSEEN
ncbi:MAG: hypothetical protein PV362_04930, partial [Providencia heimbachae]|nr:hypothetical protein [Providencia heimbachae]